MNYQTVVIGVAVVVIETKNIVDFLRISIITISSSRSSDGGCRHSFRSSSSVVCTIVCIGSCGGNGGSKSSSSGSVSIHNSRSSNSNGNHSSRRNSSSGSDSVIKWKR